MPERHCAARELAPSCPIPARHQPAPAVPTHFILPSERARQIGGVIAVEPESRPATLSGFPLGHGGRNEDW
jgi:hypothetical protein